MAGPGQRALGRALGRLLAAGPQGAGPSVSPAAALLAHGAPRAAGPPMCGSGRLFSSWEGHWASPRRSQLHSDVAAARSMLPHRAQFVPQFTPHGFQLIPESLLSPLAELHGAAAASLEAAAAAAQQQQAWASAAAAATVAAAPAAARRAVQQLADGAAAPLYADSVKRKRRLKMKKHKYRKRMRALKASLK